VTQVEIAGGAGGEPGERPSGKAGGKGAEIERGHR
jgi:hypothetical protein